MSGLEDTATLRISNEDGITVDGTDLTGKLNRLAFEIGPDAAWLAFETKADYDEIEFDFPVNRVTHHLGAAASALVGDPAALAAEIESAVIQAQATAYGSEADAIGRAVLAWLQSKGVYDPEAR